MSDRAVLTFDVIHHLPSFSLTRPPQGLRHDYSACTDAPFAYPEHHVVSARSFALAPPFQLSAGKQKPQRRRKSQRDPLAPVSTLRSALRSQLPEPHSFFPSRLAFPPLRQSLYEQSQKLQEFHNVRRALAHATKEKPESLSSGEGENDGAEAASVVDHVDVETIMVVSVADTSLTEQQLDHLLSTMHVFSSLEVLVLRNIGITHLNHLVVPHLRYLDISHNSISEWETCEGFFNRTPLLEVLLINNNAVSLRENFLEKVIVCCRRLQAVNKQPVTIEWIEDAYKIVLQDWEEDEPDERRLSQIDAEKQYCALRLWDKAVCNLPYCIEMEKWEPEVIVHIHIEDARLQQIHVGQFVNVKEIHLPGNSIRTLVGSGIERCEDLRSLDLSRNCFDDPAGLIPMFFSPMIEQIEFHSNPIPYEEYSSYILYITRFAGPNGYGLLQLDGNSISVEERINAVKKHHNDPDGKLLNKIRWRCLVRTFVQSTENLDAVLALSLPNCNLFAVNMHSFSSIQFLDLSGNPLREVYGLERVSSLRFLNLSGCENLDLENTLQRLGRTRTLEQASFCSLPLEKWLEFDPVAVLDEAEESLFTRHPCSVSYRRAVLSALLPLNRCLTHIDTREITAAERIEWYRSFTSEDNAGTYTFNLLVALECTEKPLTSYCAEDVVIGRAEYDSHRVTEIRTLPGWNLRSTDLNFSSFTSLHELDLSNNKITDVSTLGLEGIPLRVLLLADNLLTNTLDQIVDLMASMLMLECITLHGNPIMTLAEERMSLITSFHTRCPSAPLKVVDTLITEKEWISVLVTAGEVHPTEIESQMLKMCLKNRLPAVRNPLEVTEINLNGCGLKRFDVSKFHNIRKLLLRDNFFTSMRNLSGFYNASNLQVLDMRDNMLSDVEDVGKQVRRMRSLVHLGLSGNKLPENWRMNLIEGLPQLFEPAYCLRAIDDVEIGVDELIQAWETIHPDRRVATTLRVELLLQRNILAYESSKNDSSVVVTDASITELDFSSGAVSSINVRRFLNVTTLSMAYNRMTSHSFAQSGIVQLLCLEKLDIRHNIIESEKEVVPILRDLIHRGLKELYVEGNAFFRARHTFLQSLECEPRKGLELLDGVPLSIDEKVLATKPSANPSSMTRYWLRMTASKRISEGGTVANLSRLRITSLQGIETFTQIRELDLSRNMLHTLNFTDKRGDAHVFRSLPQLVVLDISLNQLQSLEETLELLSKTAPNLRVLHMIHCTGSHQTKSSGSYLPFVFSHMPGALLYVDGYRNPRFDPSSLSADTNERALFEKILHRGYQMHVYVPPLRTSTVALW